jgi:hypothetical protein
MALLLLVVVIATRPSEYTVTRSINISAAAEAIFPHVNDLRQFQVWNPWGKIDPAMKIAFEGPQSGKGAIYSWAGNNKVGEGRMTITDSRPGELVHMHMDFFKPMAGTGEVEFSFKPQGSQTVVTWTMTGGNNFAGKAFGMFMNMDKMIGGQFERGMADLKAVVEAAAKR